MKYSVTVGYDAGAKLYYVYACDVPGVYAEAKTRGELLKSPALQQSDAELEVLPAVVLCSRQMARARSRSH